MYLPIRWLCMYVCFLDETVLIWIWGWGGISDIFVNYSASRPLSLGIFFVVQPNYYFVNCIPIDTNQVKRERRWWVFFFSYKIWRPQIHVQSSSGIASVTLCSIWWTVPARLYHLFLIKSANSIWPWTASENRLPNKYITISFSQCYNFFFSPFQVFPH